ncbi:hypothetical protein ACLB2K_023362 [Fragaria x ananassa]
MASAGIHPYHQQWAPTAAPPPSPAIVAAAPPPLPHHLVDNPNWAANDEVHTIFITGLPEDVKEREIQNLLRWLLGYEASQVNYKGEKLMSFALFATAQQVIAAKDALQSMVFIFSISNQGGVAYGDGEEESVFEKR